MTACANVVYSPTMELCIYGMLLAGGLPFWVDSLPVVTYAPAHAHVVTYVL